MTKQHDIGHYLDGRVSVEFCKICSAEGEKLLDECLQKIIVTGLFDDLKQLKDNFGDRNR